MDRGSGSYSGKSAIVTGGASGIGRAIGEELHRRGAHVVLADVDAAGAALAANDSRSSGTTSGSVVGVGLDVRDRDAVQALVDSVVQEREGLDFLFNNAGISMGGPTEHMLGSHWDRIIAVNLGGVVNGIVAAYPSMIERGSGHIVNTASAAGLVSAPFAAGYSTTKHAVVGLSTALRAEAAALGVRVSALCPGMVETAILDAEPPSDLPQQAGVRLTGRAYLETLGMKPITADRLATAALRGVSRNRAIIVAPGAVRAGWFLARTSPRAIEAVGRVSARRVRREMERLPAHRDGT